MHFNLFHFILGFLVCIQAVVSAADYYQVSACDRRIEKKIKEKCSLTTSLKNRSLESVKMHLNLRFAKHIDN